MRRHLAGSADVVDPYTPGSGDPSYAATHYDLELDYKVSTNRLAARAAVTLTALEPVTRVRLDLTGMRVLKVAVDGRATTWTHRGSSLVVTLPVPLEPGDDAVVTIRYGGNPHPRSTRWGTVGWEELADGALVASQPVGASTWFPCNDHPGHKATYRFTVECDSPYDVIATGTPVSSRVRGSRTTHVFEQAHPMATYLAALHVGRYGRHVVEHDHAPVHVVYPASHAPVVSTELARQTQMLDVFADLFGPYPFDAYTVVVTPDELEIPLEAQGMATFGLNWLTGDRRHERLVAHELAHQWFGNSLTVRQWRDIWLNEGFACYAEWLWADRADGVPADDTARSHWARLQALPQDLVLADPGPDDMFDDRVYKRGALTLHALRVTVGDAVFFGLVRDWAAANRHGLVSTEEFVAHARAHAGEASDAVGDLLARWLHDTRLPPLPAPADGPAPS